MTRTDGQRPGAGAGTTRTPGRKAHMSSLQQHVLTNVAETKTTQIKRARNRGAVVARFSVWLLAWFARHAPLNHHPTNCDDDSIGRVCHE